ncbi:hypothetical protein U9M48_031932 [Paspalum notatum var. saurae]|uniref:Uncharacterized protein n=1 Tax=Paspalum notatum var. saurae TaxID=547442 RepID=A0AAQ3U6T5_PASNO
MQSLLRNVCRAGSRGAAARLLEFAAPVATHPRAAHPSSAIKHLRPEPDGFSRPIGSHVISHDCVPAACSFCPKLLVARGLKRLEAHKTVRHIMNILNKEAVEKVRLEMEIPDVQPGCIIQMRLV